MVEGAARDQYFWTRQNKCDIGQGGVQINVLLYPYYDIFSLIVWNTPVRVTSYHPISYHLTSQGIIIIHIIPSVHKFILLYRPLLSRYLVALQKHNKKIAKDLTKIPKTSLKHHRKIPKTSQKDSQRDHRKIPKRS